MAKRAIDDASLSAVADAIRQQTGMSDPLQFPDDFAAAPATLVEVGKKTAYDEFWDSFQANGSRVNYEQAFRGPGWTNVTFKPKYDIKPTGSALNLFLQAPISGSLPEILQNLGVELDLGGSTNCGGAFQSTKFTRLGENDFSQCTNLGNCFGWCEALTTIDKVIVSEACTNFGNTLAGCWALQNLTIDGTIAATISLAQCSKLTAESAKSVILHLKNFTGTGRENTQTISLHGNTWALLDAEGNASPKGNTWRDYIVSDLRWNI